MIELISAAFADEITPVAAEAANVGVPATSNGIYQFLPLIGLIVVFYFFMMRPQMKQQKQHQNMISSLKKGDKIITNSGILGVIVKIEDGQYIQVEIAQNMKVRMLKSAIAQLAQIEEKKEEIKIEEQIEEKFEK